MSEPSYEDLKLIVRHLEHSKADVRFIKNLLFRFMNEFLDARQWNDLVELACKDTRDEDSKIKEETEKNKINNRMEKFL